MRLRWYPLVFAVTLVPALSLVGPATAQPDNGDVPGMDYYAASGRKAPGFRRFLGVVATLLVNWSVVDHVNARLGYPSRAFCVGGR